jgi:predicted PurR-regulated permease PerM
LAILLQGRSLYADLSRADGPFDRLTVEVEQQWKDLPARLERVPLIGPLIGGEETAEPGAEPRSLGLRDAFGALWEWLNQEGRLAGAGQAGLKAAGGLWGVLRSIFGSVFSIFTLLFLLPIYTYFLLFELERIHEFVRHYIPRTERVRMSSIGGQIGEVLANFFRGRLLVCLLKGAFITLGLWITGVPYALIVGLVSGFLSLVPFVGPVLGFVLAFLMGLLREYTLLQAFLRVGAVYVIAELLEGYVLLPKILGDSLGLHPVVVLASLMIGGAALGMFGLLAALPLAATVIILSRELVLPALQKVADEET